MLGRSGLDPQTRRLVAGYDNIIYISCNPIALHRDLQEIISLANLRIHGVDGAARSENDRLEIVRFAVFDHFPYTDHLECGVYLARVSSQCCEQVLDGSHVSI